LGTLKAWFYVRNFSDSPHRGSGDGSPRVGYTEAKGETLTGSWDEVPQKLVVYYITKIANVKVK